LQLFDSAELYVMTKKYSVLGAAPLPPETSQFTAGKKAQRSASTPKIPQLKPLSVKNLMTVPRVVSGAVGANLPEANSYH
jgi:hypothetical protein